MNDIKRTFIKRKKMRNKNHEPRISDSQITPIIDDIDKHIENTIEAPITEILEEIPTENIIKSAEDESDNVTTTEDELDHIARILAESFLSSMQESVEKEEPFKISIIIPTYNAESYISECLDSILNQTYKNLEIIIVNDCCTDNTMNTINDYNDERLKIINHDTNKGAGASRRTGIESSTGDYVITIDSDDWLSRDFIEKLVDKAVETESDIISGGITVVHRDNYEEIKRFYPRTSEGVQKINDYNNKKIIFLNNKLVRRTMYDQTPYCTWRYCEDTPVVLKLLYHANSVSYADTQGYYYRQRDNSICHKVSQYETHLFKALCSLECIEFFNDKGEEYQNVINRQDLVVFLDTLKTQTTPELREKYCKELAELSGYLLNILVQPKR